MIGDGEAETGPLATSWHSNKFLNPAGDGAVLPILHLNGYKIANPTVLARIPPSELESLLSGYGCATDLRRRQRAGPTIHHRWPMTFDTAFDDIAGIQQSQRAPAATTTARAGR